MVSISVSIVTVIVLTIFQNLPYVNKAAPYLFTTYGNAFTSMQGNLPAQFQDPIFSIQLGVVALIAWSVVCYLIAHIVLVKRDILI